MTAKISFNYMPVQPTEIVPLVWDVAFFNYLLDRKQFPIDLAAQEQLLRTVIDGVGAKAEEMPKILEALSNRTRVWRRYQGLRKVPEILRSIEGELKTESGKMIVLGTSKDVLTEMRDGLSAYNAVLIFSGTPEDKRRYVVKKFLTEPKRRVLCAAIDAAGTALDLTTAQRVRVVEPHWFSDNTVQALMRVCNWRQQQDVDIRFYGLAGSLDEQIVRALARVIRVRLHQYVAPEQHSRAVEICPSSEC